MKLSYRPATDADYLFAFELKKATEQDLVTRNFGWDEELQWELHRQEWKSGLPTIICIDDHPVGTYMLHDKNDTLYFSRFFILPDYQGQGVGGQVLKSVTEFSDRTNLPCVLCYLQGNRAANLYQRFGFRTYREDAQFVYMKYRPGTYL